MTCSPCILVDCRGNNSGSLSTYFVPWPLGRDPCVFLWCCWGSSYWFQIIPACSKQGLSFSLHVTSLPRIFVWYLWILSSFSKGACFSYLWLLSSCYPLKITPATRKADSHVYSLFNIFGCGQWAWDRCYWFLPRTLPPLVSFVWEISTHLTVM